MNTSLAIPERTVQLDHAGMTPNPGRAPPPCHPSAPRCSTHMPQASLVISLQFRSDRIDLMQLHVDATSKLLCVQAPGRTTPGVAWGSKSTLQLHRHVLFRVLSHTQSFHRHESWNTACQRIPNVPSPPDHTHMVTSKLRTCMRQHTTTCLHHDALCADARHIFLRHPCDQQTFQPMMVHPDHGVM